MCRMLTSLLPCGSPASDTVEGKFVADMRVAPRGTVGYALDVGSQLGRVELAVRRDGIRRQSYQVHSFEPQSAFVNRLTNQTARLNALEGCRAHFYAAAAESVSTTALYGLCLGRLDIRRPPLQWSVPPTRVKAT